MTSLETTIEVPQITGLADIPVEFWIATSIHLALTALVIWVGVKIIRFVVKSLNRNMKPRLPNVVNPTADFNKKLSSTGLKLGFATALLAVFLPANFDVLKFTFLISSPVFFVCAAIANFQKSTAAKSSHTLDPDPASIDDDFADIAAEMEREKDHVQ